MTSSALGRDLVALSRSECVALLAANEFGRVAVAAAVGQAPLIRPVNYRFDEASDAVVFRTAEDSKFYFLVRAARASFEIDGPDPPNRGGWSVIVVGRAEEITRSAEIEEADRLGVRTWPDAAVGHWVRIRPQVVSGRRLLPVLDAV